MKNDKKDFPYKFHPKLILRTPRYAFNTQNSINDISSFLNDDSFLEAIYLASPVLHRECCRFKNNEIKDQKDVIRLTNSLAKYIGRMSSRATPFGLFSSCSVTSWSESKTNVLFKDNEFSRHTRLDMHYLCALAQELSSNQYIKPFLKYYPNSSIYSIANEIRYVEYKYVSGGRSHRISALASSDYLTKIIDLSKTGRSRVELASFLVDEEISLDEGLIFISELIDEQVLVSDLEPAVSGPEFINQIISTLTGINTSHPNQVLGHTLATLCEIKRLLEDLDNKVHNSIDSYKVITELIGSLGVVFDESKLFQTDMNKEVICDDVHISLQNDLQDAFTLANALYPEKRQPNLSSFARRFYERYEDQLMPLLEVLDTEAGIGYLENSNQNISPLIEGIIFSGKPNPGGQSIPFNSTSRLFFNKLKEVSALNGYEAVFTEADFKGFAPNWDDTPPSVSMLFKLVNNEDNLILVETIGGSSAANLLGRFTHADENIHNVVMDITSQEQELNKNVIFAEIIHLPESRVGNIMLHTVFRDYEIPYLGKSSLPLDQQIITSDLMIGVRHNKVILFSKKLGKEIIPRLSTAHNFTYKALPVYQFLCDLQTQNLRGGFKFSWGSMASQYNFLPRMRYKNLILVPAQWQLSSDEFKNLIKINVESLPNTIKAFREKWFMPRYVCLADGDNELLIDFENSQSIQSWLKTIENRSSILLKEFLFGPESSISTVGKAAVINQFIATLINKNPVYKTSLSEKINLNETTTLNRKFGPGSEWVYFKLYCGTKSADKILEENITLIVSELKKMDIIDKWFFIRYNDPHFHLRLRFHLNDIEDIGKCMMIINNCILHLQLEGLIWKVQLDSYEREVERYGENTIELAESIFCLDSDAILEFLSLTEGDEREEIRWLWCLRSANALLDDFSLSLEQKSQLLDVIKTSFALEFNMDKNLRSQINKRYADHRSLITTMMGDAEQIDDDFIPLINIITERSTKVKVFSERIKELNMLGKLAVSLQDLLAAYLHMLLNRLFIADARAHELIVYDIMSKNYQSQIAQLKNKSDVGSTLNQLQNAK